MRACFILSLIALQNLSKDPTNSGDYAEDILNASLACLHSFIAHDESSRSWWISSEDRLDSIVRNCLWPFQSKRRESSGHKENSLFCEYAIMILWSLVKNNGCNEEHSDWATAAVVSTSLKTCKLVRIHNSSSQHYRNAFLLLSFLLLQNISALQLIVIALTDSRINAHKCLSSIGVTIKNSSTVEVKKTGLQLLEKLFCYYHKTYTGSSVLTTVGQLDQELLYFIEFGCSLLQEFIDKGNDEELSTQVLKFLASIFNGSHCKAVNLLTPVATFRNEFQNGKDSACWGHA